MFADATYSASTEEIPTDTCFFEDQETHPLATSDTKPPTERLKSTSPAQSESVHPTISTAPLPWRPKTRENS